MVGLIALALFVYVLLHSLISSDTNLRFKFKHEIEISSPITKRYFYLLIVMLLITIPTYVIKIFTVLFLWKTDLTSRLLLAIILIILCGFFVYGWYLMIIKIKESKKIEEDFILIPIERKSKLGYRRLIGVWQNILLLAAIVFVLVCAILAYLDRAQEGMGLYDLRGFGFRNSYRGRNSSMEMIAENSALFITFAIVPYCLMVATFIFRKIRSFIDWLIEGFKSKD